MQLRELSFEDLDTRAQELGINLPIEQTKVWCDYEATIEGRTPWGAFEVVDGDDTVALLAVMDYETHGYHYLRSHHGPAWVSDPTPEQESAALAALEATASERGSYVFARLCVAADLPACKPVLSVVPYDRTVIIDVTGGDDEILSRMKPRGRRDVRKALREAPITCADETERATENFEEYYAVMVETGERDGFTPAPCSDYQRMLQMLGPDHARVFAGRDESGRVVTWSICTKNGTRGTRYYAASLNETMRMHVTDKLVYFECCELGRLGCETYDLMAIGSEFSPTLMGLNEFKTKFCKEIAEVAPDRDVPFKKLFYKSLVAGRKVMRRG